MSIQTPAATSGPLEIRTHESQEGLPVRVTVSVAVVPPDRPEFGWTSGLAGMGRPELYVRARAHEGWPGEEPGDRPEGEWRLGEAELGRLLLDLAERTLSGAEGPGDTVEEEYAGGVVARFHLGTPVPALTLEVGLPALQQVIPVRWSLHHVGTDRPPLSEAVAATVVERTHEVLAELRSLPEAGRGPVVPPAWRAPSPQDGVDLGPHQRFGPLTALVVAHGELLLRSGPPVIGALLGNAMAVDLQHLEGPARAEVAAIARLHGREDAVNRIRAATGPLTDRLSGPDLSGRWAEAVGPLLRNSRPGSDREEARDALTVALGRNLALMLSVTALADVVPAGLEAIALGPWAWARAEPSSHGNWRDPVATPPGPPWEADPEPAAWVGDRLGALTEEDREELGRRMRAVLSRPAYMRLSERLLVHRLTTPCTPPGGTVLTSTGEIALPLEAGPGVLRAAALLLVAVAVPHRVTDAEWEKLVRPMRAVLPALSERPAPGEVWR